MSDLPLLRIPSDKNTQTNAFFSVTSASALILSEHARSERKKVKASYTKLHWFITQIQSDEYIRTNVLKIEFVEGAKSEGKK